MSEKKELTFVVFLLHALSEAWRMSPARVYRVLAESQVLQRYVIPCYDVLHSFGTKYLVSDITDCVRERGYEIA